LILGPLAAAAAETLAGVYAPSESSPCESFVLPNGLLYRRSLRGDCLCVPAADPAQQAELRLQLLHELHAGEAAGRPGGWDKTLSLAHRSVWLQGLPADVEEYTHLVTVL
jgi:hypothetical protein